MSGFLRADWIRFRHRRDVLVIALALPVLAVVGYASGLTSSGNQFSFSFYAESNRTYTIEQTTTLSPVNWQTLTNMIGDGSVITATESVQAQAMEFYRVKVQ